MEHRRTWPVVRAGGRVRNETALFVEDTRQDYGEVRWQALGFLDDRLHMLVFAETATGIRVISFRKANKREVKWYEQATRP